MRVFTAGVLLIMGVTACAPDLSTTGTITECPPLPPAELGPQSPAGEGLMDDVAEETTRFGQGLVGMASDLAEACVVDAGYTWRVFEQDGEQFALTMDYRVDRINVKIEQGVVTEAYSG